MKGVTTQAVKVAAKQFYKYCADRFADDDFPQYFITVEDYLEEWVLDHEAWLKCGGDFRLFLAVAAYVFAEWHDYQLQWNRTNGATWDFAIPEHLERALKTDAAPGNRIFDAALWIRHSQGPA
jgi:hypothetical protein